MFWLQISVFDFSFLYFPSLFTTMKIILFFGNIFGETFLHPIDIVLFLHVHLQKKPHAHTHTPVHSSPTNYSPASSPSSNYQSITKPSAHTQNPNVWLKLCKVRNHCTKSLQFLSNSLPGFGDIFRNI